MVPPTQKQSLLSGQPVSDVLLLHKLCVLCEHGDSHIGLGSICLFPQQVVSIYFSVYTQALFWDHRLHQMIIYPKHRYSIT